MIHKLFKDLGAPPCTWNEGCLRFISYAFTVKVKFYSNVDLLIVDAEQRGRVTPVRRLFPENLLGVGSGLINQHSAIRLCCIDFHACKKAASMLHNYVMQYYLTIEICAHLTSHGVCVHLTHVGTRIVLLNVRHVQLPGIVPIVRDWKSWIVRY